MEYKEIYDELMTVLWGDDIAKTESKDEIGVDRGYLINLYNPFHNSLSKIDPIYHNRVFRIFKKFADKLYLETKDEYVIKLISKACSYVEEMFTLVEMTEIEGTKDDPAYIFDEYKPEEAKEPKPEDKYSLIKRTKNDDGYKEVVKNYKFYEEAKKDFNEEMKNFKEHLNIIYGIKEGEEEKMIKICKENNIVFEPNHFNNNDIELIIKKRG